MLGFLNMVEHLRIDYLHAFILSRNYEEFNFF